MNISKLTITPYDVIPTSVRKAATFTKINPDVDIAGILIKDKLRVYNTEDRFVKETAQTSKKNNFEGLITEIDNLIAREEYYHVKDEIQIKIQNMLHPKSNQTK